MLALLAVSLTDQPWFVWGLILVLGFPVAVMFLGEVIHRLERKHSQATASIRLARNVVAPALVVLLFVRYVLEQDGSTSVVRIGATVVWLFGLATLLSIVSAAVFSGSDDKSWRGRAPQLFVDVVRFFMVIVGGAFIVGSVWGVGFGGLFAAVGVGGVTIGLALQDTLASLIAGIALLSEKPFVVGDWVVINGTEGKVTDINWRTVRLRTREDDLIVVPNIVFGTTVVHNNSRPELEHVEVVPIGFSYNDPPSKVHEVMLEVARSTPGVLTGRPPRILTVGYNDSSIDYQVWLSLANYDIAPTVRSEFLSRVWYAARRNGLTIPFPIRTLYRHDADAMAIDLRGAETDRRESALHGLVAQRDDVSAIAERSELRKYATGEVLIPQGEVGDGLGVLISGKAVAMLGHLDGRSVRAYTIRPGEFYGERSSFFGQTSRVSVMADSDVEVVVIPPAAVQDLAERSPKFANAMEEVMETRSAVLERAMHSADGVKDLR